MSKSPHTPEFRAKAAQEYLDGFGSIQHLADKYHVGYATLKEWINQYRIHEISAFTDCSSFIFVYREENSRFWRGYMI